MMGDSVPEAKSTADPGEGPSSVTDFLCDLGKITLLMYGSIFLYLKWEDLKNNHL